MKEGTLATKLIECGAVKFGDFTLRSGKKSSVYIDIKKASTEPTILREIAREMQKKITKESFDKIAGLELGAVPIAVALSLETDTPYVIVRKDRKDYGTGKQIEGDITRGEGVLVVEDVTTTGESALRTVEILREAGAIVEMVLSVVDREEGARQMFDEKKINFVPLVRMRDLVGDGQKR